MFELETLPLEILFNILSFTASASDPPTLRPHPINSLAATSSHLYSVVEEYTRGLLKQHVGFVPPKSSKKFTCRRKWLAEICQLCKKSSKRRATLYPTLTMCKTCDRKHFPKMTMTNALTQYHISKLDLFTPSVLHPSLPPLATGEYTMAGGIVNMISEPDVIARSEMIHSLLGYGKAHDLVYMRRRSAAHERIIAHMRVFYSSRYRIWIKKPKFTMSSTSDKPPPKLPKSMQTKESREEYIEKQLEIERAALGVSGSSKEIPIELE